MLEISHGHQGGKFLATEADDAGQRSLFPLESTGDASAFFPVQCFLQGLGDLIQAVVARDMSVVIIEGLEVIDIHHHQRQTW